MLRRLLLWASRNAWLRDRVPRHAFARRAVRRFMPGEDLAVALEAAGTFAERRIAAVLTRLGENVDDADAAREVTGHYLDVVERAAAHGLDVDISVKLTQLGLDVDADLAYENLEALAARVDRRGGFVWIDMESSSYVDATLDLYRRVRSRHSEVGVCLQAYLYRTPDDLEQLLPLSPAIRLVKGAYSEPSDRAYPRRQDIDAAYLRLGRTVLGDMARGASVRLALGTHDVALIGRLADAARRLDLPHDVFEVQMLYGIRREEQIRLAREGGRVRVLISYGDAWYPWFVRRLAERPANVGFLLRSLFGG